MSRAVAVLIEIMNDAEAAPIRRLEATEHLLSYEGPEQAMEQAKAFLTSVFEDKEMSVDVRLDALKLMRRAEARRITRPTLSQAEEWARRERWRERETARRRVTMIEAGIWPPPKDWADDLLSDDYIAPND